MDKNNRNLLFSMKRAFKAIAFALIVLVLGFAFFYLFATIQFANSFPKKDLPNLTTEHTQLVKDLFSYKKIIDINDGTRSVKKLNHIFIKMNKNEKGNNKYYLDVLDSL